MPRADASHPTALFVASIRAVGTLVAPGRVGAVTLRFRTLIKTQLPSGSAAAQDAPAAKVLPLS